MADALAYFGDPKAKAQRGSYVISTSSVIV